MLSEAWLFHFRRNLDADRPHPWHDSRRLTPKEREAVVDSIRQFQLGEGSDGLSFLRRGSRFAAEARDPAFSEALRLFIQEEQRHSRELARFLEMEGVPLLRKHWVDQIFRRLRKLAGLELMVRVLVTAEVVAVPYYRALREATGSPLLKSICTQILADEAVHLRYQAATLFRLGRRGWADAVHRWFLYGTLLIAWAEHSRVFRAGGYRFSKLACESLDAFDIVAAREEPAPGTVVASAGLLD